MGKGRQTVRHTMANTWHNGGISSLYRGWTACLAREVPGCIIWFGAYEATSSYLMHNFEMPRAAAVMSGGISAALAFWLTCMPLDRIKTLQQASMQTRANQSMLDVAMHIN